MQIKVLEIRDRMTCIPVLAIQMASNSPARQYWLRRNGYPEDGSCIVVMRLADQQAHADAYDWPDGARTMRAAHLWIDENFDQLAEGDVVDVRVISGEAVEPAKSERLAFP